HQRPETADSVIEKGALEFDDRVGDLKDRLLTLINRLHQPFGGTKTLLQILFGLRASLTIVHHALVIAGEPQPRNRTLIEGDDLIVSHLYDEHIGDYVGRLLAAIVATRFRLQ